MPFLCAFVCGKQKSRLRKKKRMDFRKADPRYVNFVPKTCAEAIDLFNRHRALGLQSNLYPECFVHCARALPDKELDNFHRFIVCPTGDIEKGGEAPTALDAELEKERLQLLKEAEAREKARDTILEEEEPSSIPDEDEKEQEEEKLHEEVSYAIIHSER